MLQPAICLDKETHTHRGRDPRPAHRARQDSTLFSPMANDPLGHHADRSPQCGVPQASALSLLARNERRARSKGEQRRLSERNTGSSPVRRRSINNYPAAAGGDLSATSIGALLAWSASHCLFRLTHSPYFRLWRMTHRVTTRIVPHAAVNGLGRDDILGALLCGSHVCCFTLNPGEILRRRLRLCSE